MLHVACSRLSDSRGGGGVSKNVGVSKEKKEEGGQGKGQKESL